MLIERIFWEGLGDEVFEVPMKAHNLAPDILDSACPPHRINRGTLRKDSSSQTELFCLLGQSCVLIELRWFFLISTQLILMTTRL